MGGSQDGTPKQRSKRFTPKEQGIAVWLSHAMVLVVVILVMVIGMDEPPPLLFVAAEGGILVIILSVASSFVEDVAEFIARYWESRKQFLMGAARRWTKSWGPPVAFAGAFLLQYVAVTPLVLETGGATASPFAQLAVAFAVFTPLLANERRTVWISLGLFLGYYAFMIVGFGRSGDVPEEGVFFAVTALIVVVTVILTMLDRSDGDRLAQRGADGAT